jgi:hypothetical protein
MRGCIQFFFAAVGEAGEARAPSTVRLKRQRKKTLGRTTTISLDPWTIYSTYGSHGGLGETTCTAQRLRYEAHNSEQHEIVNESRRPRSPLILQYLHSLYEPFRVPR